VECHDGRGLHGVEVQCTTQVLTVFNGFCSGFLGHDDKQLLLVAEGEGSEERCSQQFSDGLFVSVNGNNTKMLQSIVNHMLSK
jgi:hypothetical protein